MAYPDAQHPLSERFKNHKSYRKIEDDIGVPFSTVQSWCAEYSDNPDMNKRRHIHDPEYEEHRSRPLLISDAQVRGGARKGSQK